MSNSTAGFLEMSDIVEECMNKIHFIEKPTYDDYVMTDEETRRVAILGMNKNLNY